MTDDDQLVLHSSRARLGLSFATPVLLLLLGGYAALRALTAGPLVVLALGLGMAGVVALDLPLRTEFDRDGLRRVCLLRQHRLPWSEVVAVERTGAAPSLRSRGQDPPPVRATRGLTARTGPRRLHLLTDRRESHAEWTAIRDLLADRATQLRASAPPIDAAPAGRGPRALHRRAG